jgi:predicted ATP-grasp superfamily ATP-dependent carboligase/protein-tyrosine-phosphatase
MKRPTLILGFEPRIVIPIARSLHEHNVRVTAAAFSGGAGRTSSRAIQEFLSLPNPGDDLDRCLSAITALIRKEQFDFLIPCSDSTLLATSQLYDQLNGLLALSCPPPPIIERVLEKRITLAVAERCGVPIPATFHISSLEELEAVRDRLTFPIICKPSRKQGRYHFKVKYFCSYRKLKDSFDWSKPFGDEVLLQPYVEGEGVGVEALIHKGEPLALFQHRRVRELPSTGGVSVVAVSEALDADLVDAAITLLRGLEWEGIAMVEFKYDRATRKAVLMEVNGRYWGALSVALHAGMDFPLYDWQLAHGERPQVPTQYGLGVRVRWLTGDLQRVHELLIESKAERVFNKSRWGAATDFLTDFRPSTRDMLFSLRDPAPGFLELGRAIRKLASGDLKRFLRKILPRRFVSQIQVYRRLGGPAKRTYFRLQALRVLGVRKGWFTPARFGISSVLFVCHGNIIRSPLAAALLKQQLSYLDRKTIRVSSAGVHAKPGRCADERVCLVAKEIGISLDEHRAQLLTLSLIKEADLVFVMDYLVEAQLLTLYPDVASKVFMLHNGIADGEHGSDEVVDPFHGDLADVRHCYNVLESRLSRLAQLIVDSGSNG